MEKADFLRFRCGGKWRGFAGAVMCETRDLDFKWPQWHTLLFEGHARVDMR